MTCLSGLYTRGYLFCGVFICFLKQQVAAEVRCHMFVYRLVLDV